MNKNNQFYRAQLINIANVR